MFLDTKSITGLSMFKRINLAKDKLTDSRTLDILISNTSYEDIIINVLQNPNTSSSTLFEFAHKYSYRKDYMDILIKHPNAPIDLPL